MDTSNLENRDKNADKGTTAGSVSPDNEGAKTFTHKYKWTFEEIGIISALVIGVAFTVIGYTGQQLGLPLFIFLLVIEAALLGYLFTIGFGRKKKSRLVATYNPETTELVVEGNGYKPAENHGKLADVVSASEKRIGINDTLVLHFKDKNALHVPARVAGKPGLYALLEDTLVNKTDIATKKPEILEFLEKAKNYKK